MDALIEFLRSSEFMPNKHCYLASQGLAVTNFIANLHITIAYVVGIPWALVHYVRPLGLARSMSFWILVAFIVSCGLGHAIGGSNLYLGQYRFETAWNVLTGTISWIFVASLVVEVRPFLFNVQRAIGALHKLIEMEDALPPIAVEYVRRIKEAVNIR